MARIAENTVIVDGQEYKPGDVIPDFKSIKCVDTREPRKYQGLSADVSVLNDVIAKYASGGASCFMSDTGEYYEYNREEKTWKLITNITERGFDSEKAYGALRHMLKNVTVSDEKIQSAVTDYLTVNPVLPGATTEQARQIEQNKTDVASLKEDISYYPANVKKYGAVGDGVTDDTIAIKNALKSNYAVYFPNGEYIVSDAILLRSKQKIKGEQRHNTIIKYVGDNSDTLIPVISSEDGAHDCIIENMTIDAGDKCVCVYLQATSEEKLEQYDTHGIVKDCDIKNATYGVRIGGKCRGSFFKNLYLKNCSRHAIYVQGTDNFLIECVGIQIQWSGVYLQSSNNMVRNCRMGLCNKANNGNAGYLVESINNSLIGCTAQQNYRNALVINNTSRCLIESFQSDWNNAEKVTGYDTAHIKLLNSTFCKLSGIIIDGEIDNAYSVYGLLLEGSTSNNVLDFVIAHNAQSNFTECNAIKEGTLAKNNVIIINGNRWGIN